MRCSPKPGGWPEPGGDVASTRSVGGPIDAASVPRLRVLWRFRFPDSPTFSGVDAATPLVLDGRVYVQTLQSNVYALNARTGAVVWRRRFSRPDGGPNGLATDGTPAVRQYRHHCVCTFAQDRRASVDSQADGCCRTDRYRAPSGRRARVHEQHRTHCGGRGTLFALSARTGKLVWRFDTILGAWRVPREASGGGAWRQPTLDGRKPLRRNSNPLPWGGSTKYPNGAAYAGRDLYTDSLIVLNARTGRLRWYDQVTRHYVRDHDCALPRILAEPGGEPLVIGAGKAGLVIAWNRRTHRRVWTAAVGLHRHDRGPLSRRSSALSRLARRRTHAHGLRRWTRVRPRRQTLHARQRHRLPAQLPQHRLHPPNGRAHRARGGTGRRLWTHRLPSPDSAVRRSRGDGVFTATYAGVVYAFDAADGRLLWSAQEPAGINACPSVAG